MNVLTRVLVVIDDRHAEDELRRALEQAAARGQTPTVLTSDALLTMRLTRERIDAHLAADSLTRESIDRLDAIALSAIAAVLDASTNQSYADLLGEGLGSHLEYALIPTFIRAVRNVGVIEQLTGATAFERMVVVGSGPLTKAARLVAETRRMPVEQAGGLPWQRLQQAIARIRAGRHVRWVGTEFRSIVLEPGFLLLLYAEGLWRHLTRLRPPLSRNALIVTGDRWTADIVDRLDDPFRTIVLAGATQPGRALFRSRPQLIPIESFGEVFDMLKIVAGLVSAAFAVPARVTRPPDPLRFEVNGISFWLLVIGAVRRHVIVWIPMLEHLRSLMTRVARLCPEATLLTSADAPTYASALIAVARECGLRSAAIQHGLMGEPNGHTIVRADTMAAWGSATERWYREHAPQTASFVVTGYPPYDALAARRQPEVPQPARGAPLFTVIVCTSFVSDFSVCASDSVNLTMAEAVLEWARKGDHVRIVLKMHPGEERSYYEMAADALGWRSDRFTMTNEPILYDLLQTSDVLVTGYSSTALESVMLGTPAIVCDFVHRDLLPVDRVPGVTLAYSAGELQARLDAVRAAGKPDREKLRESAELFEYVFPPDGKAVDRIAALVKHHVQREV